MAISDPEDERDASAEGQVPPRHVLGLSTSELAGLSVDELTGNKTAIVMVMHYYNQLDDENTSLKNDLNTLKTYVNGYQTKKTNSRVGAFLLLASNICLGFAVNLLTEEVAPQGFAVLIPGLIMAGLGTYLSLKESR